VRTVSAGMATHLAGSAHTLATCWLVTRTDTQVFGFTTHDTDLLIDGVTYAAATGIDRRAIESRDGLSVDNAEAIGFLNSAAITEDDLRAGVWDHAEIRVFEVNWADLTMGDLKQMRGWLGEVKVEGETYKAELRGLMTALNTKICEPYTPGCRNRLGDSRCQIDLTDYTATGTVFTVTSNREFDSDLPSSTVRLDPSSTGAPTAGYFEAGRLTWLTGANAGRKMEVKSYAAGGDIELQLAMTSTVAPGDTFSVHRGCDKTRDGDCFTVFENVVNFRGHPDLPGTDKILRVGGQ